MRASIRLKLLAAFLALSLAPLLILLFFSGRIINSGFNRMTQLRISSALDGIRADLSHRVRDLRDQTGSIARSEELLKKLLITDQGRIDHRGLIDLMVEMRASVGLSLLEVYDARGVVLAKGHKRADFGATADAPGSHNQEVLDVIVSGKPRFVIGPENILDREVLALKVFVPIRHRDEVTGVLMGGIVVDAEFLARLRALSNAVIMVVQGDEIALSSRDLNDRVISREDVRLAPGPSGLLGALSPSVGRIYTTKINGMEYLVGRMPLKDDRSQDYSIAAAISTQELRKVTSRLYRVLIRTLLVVLAVALAVGTYLSYRVAQPIRELASGAGEVARGNLDVRVTAKASDEVGQLIKAFNQMTEDLKVNRERLLHSERIAAWKDIARRIAHEIKNPLFPIQLSIQGLQKSFAEQRPDFKEIFSESTATVLEEVDRLRRLADEFSQFARMPSPMFRAIDVNDVVQGTLTLFRDVPENIKIDSILTRDLPPARADRDQITQVILNLIKNAIESMPAGGRITVETGLGRRPRTAGREGRKPVFADEPGAFAVRISVTDAGAGIPRDHIRSIFTPYFTTKESGTGLGLAIVKRVIDDHGGWIEVTSSPGRGTTMAVHLPLWEETDEQGSHPGGG